MKMYNTIIFLLLSSNLLFSQKVDSVYYDLYWDKCSKELACYFSIIKIDANYTGKQTDYFISGEKQQIVDLKNGSKTGSTTYWYRNGQKSAEGNYKMGLLDGLFTNFYVNGQKSAEHNYLSGKYQGEYTLWHPNGIVKEEGVYKDGKQIDNSKTCDENGNRYYLQYRVDKKPLFLNNKVDIESSLELNN